MEAGLRPRVDRRLRYLAVFGLFQVADLMLTTLALSWGATEWNPVMAWFFARGWWGAALVKFVPSCCGYGLYLLWHRVTLARHGLIGLTWLMGGVVAYEIGGLLYA